MRIEDAQIKLNQLGLYKGIISGVADDETKQAIKKFQKMHPPLKVTGELSNPTIAELDVPLFRDKPRKEGSVFWGHSLPTYDELVDFYGKPNTNQTLALLPYKMKLAWNNQIISRFSCHRKVAESIQEIFEQTLYLYGEKEVRRLGLDIFGGCLNVRLMRGGSKMSVHSWGIAVDIDPIRNQLKFTKSIAQLAKPEYYQFWEVVEKCGGVSLGRTLDYDWMHLQFCRVN